MHAALGDRKGPWPTFCCLDHSDVNSHFKNFNTSNTSLTLGEPHKLKHTLSTLSSKHDSMCHRKTCMGQKNHCWEPRINLVGNSKFSESFKWSLWPFLAVSSVSMKNPDIWNFYSSPTMNNGKLIRYFRSHLSAIVPNMAHFLIPFGMRENNGLFPTVFHLHWYKI